MVEAVDVFIGGKSGPNARAGTKVLEDVPCDDLPEVLERMVPYVSKKRPGAAAKAAASDGASAAPVAAAQGLALNAIS